MYSIQLCVLQLMDTLLTYEEVFFSAEQNSEYLKWNFNQKGKLHFSSSPSPWHIFFGGFWQVPAPTSGHIAAAIQAEVSPLLPPQPSGSRHRSQKAAGPFRCEATSSHNWLPTVSMPVPGTEAQWKNWIGDDCAGSWDRPVFVSANF